MLRTLGALICLVVGGAWIKAALLTQYEGRTVTTADHIIALVIAGVCFGLAYGIFDEKFQDRFENMGFNDDRTPHHW